MTIELIQVGIQQGLILALIAFGIMIPFRFLNFPDLTAEGAYPLGGAVSAILLSTGKSAIISIILGSIAGGILAFGTAMVALKLRVNSLLSGIILSTMAYSVILRILGKPNISLFEFTTSLNIPTLAIILIACTLLFRLFLYTDFGLRFRTVGLNPKLAKNFQINSVYYVAFGLFIAGGMYGLAGSLIVQIQQFMDIGMGVGIVIHGLAALMVGEAIIGTHTITRQLTAPIIGALIYQQIQGMALSLGLAPSDLKFFTGSIVLIVLYLQRNNSSN